MKLTEEQTKKLESFGYKVGRYLSPNGDFDVIENLFVIAEVPEEHIQEFEDGDFISPFKIVAPTSKHNYDEFEIDPTLLRSWDVDVRNDVIDGVAIFECFDSEVDANEEIVNFLIESIDGYRKSERQYSCHNCQYTSHRETIEGLCERCHFSLDEEEGELL